MPRIPSPTTLTAATASLAYANAKLNLGGDVWSIWLGLNFALQLKLLEKRDRMNCFYTFEDFAKDPKSASRSFLAIPQEPGHKGQTEWSYAESYELVLKYARWLKDTHGVQKNEIIAMDFKNSPQFVWLWFALWSLGAQPAFINTNLRDNAFIHCVKISSARLLILDPELGDAMTDEARSQFAPDDKGRAVETVVLDSALEQHIHSLTPYRAPNEARSGAMAADASLLIYTSGTTGLPKAANVNWGKPRSGMLVWYRLLEMKASDRYFTAMPLYHSSASLLGVCQVLGSGSTIIVSSKFSPRTYMKQVSETKATIMQYIGEMCRYLVSSPPSPYDRAHSVRTAFGNGMRPDVWQRFKDRFGIANICEFYGATEGPAASSVFSRNDFLRGTIGRSGLLLHTLFGGNAVLVRHDHETDEPWRDPKTGFCVKVSKEESGELMHPLDPENVEEKFQGYFGNDKASSSKILRNVFKKGDAYYRTGDLQKRDYDGRIWFMDRIGDTFRWKGENVSTAEVAEALGSHPALKEANVYGVQLPNHDGRAGCAAIGLTDGQTIDNNLTTQLASHARQRLPKYAVPIFLRVMKEFEVTGTFKHQKVSLRNQGVDPSNTGEDEILWLPPGADKYTRFNEPEWKRIVGGEAKL